MMIRSSKVTLLFASVMSLMLAGCASIKTNSVMSNSIFFEPVSPNKRVVYVRVRSTADRKGIDLDGAIRQGVREAGYRITDDPNKAYFLLQANVLAIGEFDPDRLRAAVLQGPSSLGGLATGVATGIAIADELEGKSGAAPAAVLSALITAALIDGAVSLVYDKRLYAVLTDIEIATRTETESESVGVIQQGDSTSETQRRRGKSQWLKYRARVSSEVIAVNTPWEVVAAELSEKLSQSIGGML